MEFELQLGLFQEDLVSRFCFRDSAALMLSSVAQMLTHAIVWRSNSLHDQGIRLRLMFYFYVGIVLYSVE